MNSQKTMPSFDYPNASDTVADSRKGIELEFEATMLEADKIDDTEINENERIWATVNLIRAVRFRLGLRHVRY